MDAAADATPGRQPGQPLTQSALIVRFVVVLAAWTVLTTLANLLAPGSPRQAWFVLMVIAAMLLPPAAFAVAYRCTRHVRSVVLGLDLSAVTAVQAVRVAGIAMLTLWATGSMTPAFSLWAGGLDVVVGLTAVPVAYTLAAYRPAPRRALRAWHALGLLDFAVAIPLGVLMTPAFLGPPGGQPPTSDIFTFPLSFIPMVGVPFAIIMHLTALIQLRTGVAPSGPLLHPSPAPRGTDA